MLSKFLPAALLVALLPVTILGQEGGGGMGGPQANGSGLQDSVGARALTPTETFAARLKLDEKTQVAPAQAILEAAAREAAPVATQLLQLRQAILNAEISKQADAISKATAAYADAAGKLATIEAAAFAKIYATLKPNQQAKAGDAFELLPIIIAPGTPARGGRPGGGGRGRGGQ